ncbi:DNA mismatch repair endonuclease MutL [Roseofilum capinflatum]|uniref:DNA mismatch repair protein MutL n=1 Tax=Roseofilum capinflatum BLCC-M114 TaxID=3022440 RepID=A0ABT7B1Y0_9CYAN|nr:DNA mismatch repair endonuclease MutL [Roseofilum capinflatum BLCC-M114]
MDSPVSTIQSLPPDVVHRIAAGEVIDSIAAVVRELVENALDAGATRLEIEIWPQQWRVRVADNGEGMNREDLIQAARSHTTSKIHTITDLDRITSLGFRGEALHSLAQLSQLEIWSRGSAGEGWRVQYNALGEPDIIDAVAIAPGTIVEISHLFETWALRRQGFPSPPQQLRAIQTLIQNIALCHPHIAWKLSQDSRPWFTISPGKNAQSILPQLLRDVQVNDLCFREVALEQEGLNPESDNLELVLGLPDRCHRGKPDWVKIAVNGRLVQCPELENTAIAAMSRTVPNKRYPVCFLHLHLSCDRIDWNRHPAKSQIYLHPLKPLQDAVQEAICDALKLSDITLPQAVHQERVGQLLRASEKSGSYQVAPKSNAPTALALKAVAQVRQTYIVAEHPGGLWLVEQHIAHERILYEELCDRWQLVPLDPPIILNHLTPKHIEQLIRIGLDVDPFGEGLHAIRNAPQLLQQRDDCAEALRELATGGDLETAQVATACRSAIRNGTPLSIPEMQDILDQWQRTRNPHTCPHGRPIYLSLEETSLARFFRRHWVIGKSHGIQER